jgi:hypothetical protein
MQIAKLVQSLLPTFTKNRILEDITMLREELKANTLGPFKTAVSDFGTRKWASTYAKSFEKAFEDAYRNRYTGNYIKPINDTLLNIVENLDSVSRMVDLQFGNDVMRDAMNALGINLIQWVETAQFFVKYSRRLLVCTLTAEVNSSEKDKSEFEGLVDAEVQWLAVNRDNYLSALNIMAVRKAELEKKLEEVPNVVVNEQTIGTLSETVGTSKLDPMNFGLIPVALNPIYHIRMAVAEWQVARFNSAQAERKMLEFRILQLKQSSSGKRDARLEEEIVYNQGRLDKLNYKLNEMESNYG